MIPATHGRYCGACEKVVIDFSQMTDDELTDFLAARSSERVCGRFRPDQLRQPQPAPMAVPPSWARWLAAAAVVLSSCEMPPPLVGELNVQQAPPSSEFFIVRGHVTDRDTHEPLAKAYITCLQDTTHQVRSEPDGSFELLLPMQLMGSKLMVEVDNTYYSSYIVTSAPKLEVTLGPQLMGAILEDSSDADAESSSAQQHMLILGTPSVKN
ncbi:hypothetical protein GCM10011383_13890 [Hymenobacter cavernae]|uniref:Carboxypeptidase regulatory-like domain-containing protein n=2 Tax=Hymenobacter cavernae TaxID=2044852 RepID=A0ABQ1TUD9_9BACT|nr:hypothetical protein GCM10011383_13890 [Hymenobacter cavernae]